MGVSGVGQQRKSEIYSLSPLRDPEMAKFTSVPQSAVLGHGSQNAIFGPEASISPETCLRNANSHPGQTESETLGMEPRNRSFNMPFNQGI